LRNDGASLTDSVVKRPSIDGNRRASILDSGTCDKERVWTFLGYSGTERSRIHTQETCKVPHRALWGEHLGNVPINVEIHLQSFDVKTDQLW